MRRTAITIQALLFCHLLAAQFAADTVFTQVEQMPYFPGCEKMPNGSDEKRNCSNLELVRFISRQLVYPDSALLAGIEGTVYVSFIVDEQGRVLDPHLLIDIGGGCGEAALDIIGAMPNWQPGRQQGQPVKVKLNLPIQFFMKNGESDIAESYSLSWGDLKGSTATKDDFLENLDNAVNVRGPEGNNRYVDELTFEYEKNGKVVAAKSHGEINEDLRKLIQKVKKGGVLTITASMQNEGQFIRINKSFQIVH